MPLKSYAVLKARPKATRSSAEGHPHFQIQLEAAGVFYRAAINVRSMMEPSEMEYLIKLRFGHPITAALRRLQPGLHPVKREPGGLALDYIRLNLFHRDQFLTLPGNDGDGADLNGVLEGIFAGAIADPGCWVYIYGEPWESESRDHIFHFHPSCGMHDIHMNQGNDPLHLEQDGVWQDGAVFIEHARQQRWTALFLKFQSQSWRTDPHEGHTLPLPAPCAPECNVRIVAALVNPPSNRPATETVTLLNISPQAVDLTGWQITGGERGRWRLEGKIRAGEAREFPLGPALPPPHQRGGILTLINREGIKVHGVYYTPEQASLAGWRIPF